MPKLTREDRVVRAIIKDHGAVIDLRRDPNLFIELVRKYAFDLGPFADTPDAGPPLPGGVPDPRPGPGPTSLQGRPQIDDLMREILKIQRKIAEISRKVGR